MSSTMEGLLRPQKRFVIPQYYLLPIGARLSAKCVIFYEKRYFWLNHRLGEEPALDLSRCEN